MTVLKGLIQRIKRNYRFDDTMTREEVLYLLEISEELEEQEIRDAWEAGEKHHHFSDGPGKYAPNLETYIQNLKA